MTPGRSEEGRGSSVRLAWRRLAHAVLLWLALASAATHALVPVGSPLARGSGSAFSAFTSDVSLGPSRRSAQSKLKKHQAAPGEEAAEEPRAAPDLPLVLPKATSLPLPDGTATPLATWPLEAAPVTRFRSGFQARAPPLS